MNMTRTDEEILECYAEVLANLKEMLNEDIMVLITNRTHRLHSFPGIKMVPDFSKIGNVLRPQDNKVLAMETGKVHSYVVDKKLFGYPFMSIDYPIRNQNGEVICCVGIGRSLEKEHKVEEISQALAATLEQVNASLQEVASGSQGLSNTINNMVHSANETNNKIQEINKVITAITDISNHSNLLGLNAAIEAHERRSRRGFALVAEKCANCEPKQRIRNHGLSS
jgi:uncharacterized protein YoxC